eukprot:4165135-Amphidinium_carterae.1
MGGQQQPFILMVQLRRLQDLFQDRYLLYICFLDCCKNENMLHNLRGPSTATLPSHSDPRDKRSGYHPTAIHYRINSPNPQT